MDEEERVDLHEKRLNDHAKKLHGLEVSKNYIEDILDTLRLDLRAEVQTACNVFKTKAQEVKDIVTPLKKEHEGLKTEMTTLKADMKWIKPIINRLFYGGAITTIVAAVAYLWEKW